MQIRQVRIPAIALALCPVAASALFAAGRARLELVGEDRSSALAFQEWVQVLGKAGVKDVRIRAGDQSAMPGDRPAKVDIAVQGTPQSPLYVVTGIVKSRDELLLPCGVFRRSDAARLARWLDDLAAHGPPDRRPQKSAFGLTAEQFQQVHQQLARPVDFSTRAAARAEVVAKIGRQLQLPLQFDAESARALGDDTVEEELRDLSCGTALACVLRPAGYCLVPRAAGGKLVCAVVQARPALEIWPVGWEPPPDQPPRDVLPILLEFLNVNIQKVPAAQAVEAIGQRLKVPVLLDHNALARHGIDPAKAIVSLPQGRTTYSQALRRLLSQAGLKFEVRLDEAGKPFLWISTVKPV
jgi:hypothetical protein